MDIACPTVSHNGRVGDYTELAYRRGDMLQKRGDLMEAWARFVEDSNSNMVLHLVKDV